MTTKEQYETPSIETMAFLSEQIFATSTQVSGSFIDELEEDNFGTF
ncbi:MAG: hypothetical protein ACI3ZS_05860 [Candidatus Cryptobacteroides sp.]